MEEHEFIQNKTIRITNLAGDPIHFLKIGPENKKKQDDKGDHTEVGAWLPSPLILSK